MNESDYQSSGGIVDHQDVGVSIESEKEVIDDQNIVDHRKVSFVLDEAPQSSSESEIVDPQQVSFVLDEVEQDKVLGANMHGSRFVSSLNKKKKTSAQPSTNFEYQQELEFNHETDAVRAS